ncbi:hypothetical protein ACLBWX_22575 [Methylobacterium sp. M6A4_1b]
MLLPETWFGAMALFLPKTWTGDPDRMPEYRRTARTKPEIAVGEIG